MRRLFVSVLAVSVLLAVAAGPAAGKASITAPDGLHFGDSFMPTFVEPSNLHGDFLFASASCQAATGGWAQTVYLDGPYVVIGNPAPFTIGNTPTWSSGPATCVVSLVLFDAQRGTFRTIASDPFEVAG